MQTVPISNSQLLPQDAGSLLLAPIETDLRLYERKRDGGVKAQNVSSVRFSELEVGDELRVEKCIFVKKGSIVLQGSSTQAQNVSSVRFSELEVGCYCVCF